MASYSNVAKLFAACFIGSLSSWMCMDKRKEAFYQLRKKFDEVNAMYQIWILVAFEGLSD